MAREMEPLTVASRLESLTKVATYVMAAAAVADLSRRATYLLRLAVDEIATNIITHGYREAGLEGTLTVSAVMDDEQLEICLEDSGVRYDPRQVHPPDDLHRPAEKRQAGGLGVYLALQGVDQFHYERVQGCNRSTFIVLRRSA